MNQVTIGTADQFDSFPAEIVLDRRPYYLMKEDGAYRLVSRRCPHAGYTVDIEDGEFVCPMHGWTFETDTGRCHNVPSAMLAMYEVIVEDGTLIAILP
ncbi:Rieske (2Fe-2S) protein [Paenibacillus chartarius]|uniref:Rieske (2Fe-2S) protein n=1 Tax=Paenibacillus chartarius TaxID=747481 RepID=A0ABV6DRJ1_9BACL